LISPGGFEEYFFEMAAPFNARDGETMLEIRTRYRLDVRLETAPLLLARHGLEPPF
jgi:hypothetical protein